ncbi:MAG: hypothetical protein JO290_12445 [Sphingomonadaceae bacterium]|nr:hypothetical protein [Sphingomonadaceae bacterium]
MTGTAPAGGEAAREKGAPGADGWRWVKVDDAPALLRGPAAIGGHLGILPRHVEHLDRQRHLPTFRLPHDSALFATAAALDDWRRLDAVQPLLK